MPEQVKQNQTQDILRNGGEMGVLMRSLDWSKTLVGPLESWPQSLRTSISILLASRFPMIIFWGPKLVQFYNDPYRPMLGTTKHPAAMGQSAQECWPEIWPVIGPMLQGVLETGEATWSDNQLLFLNRNGYVEECYFTFSYSAIRDEGGGIGGVFCAVTETTGQVLGERRLHSLRQLAADTAQAKTLEAVGRIAVVSLADNPADLPFGLVYIMDEVGKQANLAGIVGIEPGVPIAPPYLELKDSSPPVTSWPLAQVAQTRQVQMVTNLKEKFGPLPLLEFPNSPHSALVLPLARSGDRQLRGILVVGLSPFRAVDDEYKGFVQLIADSITIALANVEAYQEERKRAESLAELDRAKTAFFSNVSHEFRTPLTLMLGPLEDALANVAQDKPDQQRERLEMIQRNSLRLLKLVNNLLDFSRIEAGRVKATYQLTDLPTYTAELASVFRSAIERVGLRLIVDCPPLPETISVYVDREMWEKIVLNLLSNALKFTFQGEISVRLCVQGERIALEVQDSGTGIPASELPQVFERFHQVQGAQARTYEGSGIGLALVQELVKLHGGTIGVESTPGEGTTFTVSLPPGIAHLPLERIITDSHPTTTTISGSAYLAEAARWSPNLNSLSPEPEYNVGNDDQTAFLPSNSSPYVLIADDNADMRDYLQRLLVSKAYRVKAVADGLAALAAVREQKPNLIISDVMMPNLDGFALLKELRATPEMARIPIILLSARAGEEAVVEGMEVGADDYLVKPFAAYELLARVQANLKLAEAREDLIKKEQTARTLAEVTQQRMFRLFKEAPFFTCILRGFDHVFDYANDLYLQIIGNKDILGKPVREALFDEAYEPFYQLLDEVYRTGVSFISTETLVPKMVRHPGGLPGDAYLAFIYQATRDANGQIDGILIHGVDVTDQVLARQRVDFLAKASTLLAASLDYETTLSTVAGLAVPELADWCIVDILDQNQAVRRVAVTHADPGKAIVAQEVKNLIPNPTKSHPVLQVLTNGQAIVQFDVQAFPKEAMLGHPDYWSIADRMELHSRLIVPMTINGKVLGAISLIYSRSGRFYDETDLQFALELARRAALAVDNSRLYQIEQQAHRQEVFLNEVNSTLAQSLDYVQTLQSITRLLVPGCADYCVIDLLDETGKSNWVASHHFDPNKLGLLQKLQEVYHTTDNPKGLIKQAVLAQKASLIEMIEPEQTAQLTPTNEIAQLALALATRSMIIIPMIVRNQVIGTITIGLTKGGNRPDSEHYTRNDLELMEEVARRATVAIDNARLYQEAQQAIQTQKELDTLKDLFISIVSHELRSPLTSIKGFGQMMQRSLSNAAIISPNGQERRKGHDKLLRQVATILRQTNRMNDLIKQLMDFSRLQNDQLELNLEPGVNLIELVKQVIEQQQVASEGQLDLALQTDEKAIIGRWDTSRVEQVLTNLISNSIKYSPPNSQIVVGVKQCSIPSSQKGNSLNAAEEPEVVVWVKDEGQGISAEHQASLFSRFYRARTQENAKVEGLGLGLYISHEIVTQHGGRMWVESEVGKGSTFYFTLPLEAATLGHY